MPVPNGSQDQPLFDLQDDSDFPADLSAVSNYAALVGNRKTGTRAARDALTGSKVWDGLEYYATDERIVYTYVLALTGWQPTAWPGLVRHWKPAGFFANNVGGGQTIASRTVPVQPYAQRIHLTVLGQAGFGGNPGYVTANLSWTGAGVTVTSNGKSYTASPTDAGAENGTYFPAGQFITAARMFDIDIPAGLACSLTIATDASVVAYYRLAIEGHTYGAGEFA